MREYVLDKIFDANVLYRTETDKAYIIEKIGTDSTTRATLTVDGAVVNETIVTQSPLAKVNTNLNGLLDLGANYIVIPPAKPFIFTGSAGSFERFVGKIIELAPAETLPTAYLARFTEQARKYYTYLFAEVSKPAGTVIPAGAEEKVLEFTVPVGERAKFDRYFGAQVIVDTTVLPADDWAFRFYVDDKAYDIIETVMGKLGIANRSAPYPAREDVNFEPFSLEKMPLDLTAGKTLKVTFINTSGVAYTVPAGQTLRAQVHIQQERIRI